MDKGFEGAAVDGAASEVNALDQLDEARRAREERMELTKRTRTEGERQLPNMNINPQKLGGLAGRRHQLHSLLTEAYMNREAIEEKIAQGKRNRKEAGNKYGVFWINILPSHISDYLLRILKLCYTWMTFRWLTIFQREYLAVPSRTLADPVKYLNSMNFPVGHWNRTIAWRQEKWFPHSQN